MYWIVLVPQSIYPRVLPFYRGRGSIWKVEVKYLWVMWEKVRRAGMGTYL